MMFAFIEIFIKTGFILLRILIGFWDFLSTIRIHRNTITVTQTCKYEYIDTRSSSQRLIELTHRHTTSNSQNRVIPTFEKTKDKKIKSLLIN